MINGMSLGDNHECAGKTNISKTAPSSQESLRNGNTGRVGGLHEDFPYPENPCLILTQCYENKCLPTSSGQWNRLEPSRDGDPVVWTFRPEKMSVV